MHGQQDVTGRCSLSLFSGVEHKKHTTFHFLQKFIKQFSCLQLQPVERERKKKHEGYSEDLQTTIYNNHLLGKGEMVF